MGRPPPQILGGPSPSPLGLRPWELAILGYQKLEESERSSHWERRFRYTAKPRFALWSCQSPAWIKAEEDIYIH